MLTKFLQSSKPQKMFVEMQLRNVVIEKFSRRYTNDKKISALFLYKKSPSAYRYLSYLFTLPSKSILQSYLSNVPLDTGVNNTILKHLTEVIKDLRIKDKQFAMCWDEVHVRPHLAYNSKKDKIIGFEDFGTHRTSKFADPDLVFMTRSIADGSRLPFSYYYCNAQTKYDQLIECIRSNIRGLNKSGLSLVVTTCDQGTFNVKALKQLKQEYLITCKRNGVEPGKTFILFFQ